jgi:hypothetical protein
MLTPRRTTESVQDQEAEHMSAPGRISRLKLVDGPREDTGRWYAVDVVLRKEQMVMSYALDVYASSTDEGKLDLNGSTASGILVTPSQST